MSCSRTQCSDAGEALNRGPLGLESSTLPLSHCTPEMLCSPEHTKPLRLDCFTEPHLDFAFMNKSLATMPHFYEQVIKFATGASSLTCVNSNVSCFAINVYKKMVYRLNQTRDELHIHTPGTKYIGGI